MQPTVYLVIGSSHIAFEEETGEILETVDLGDDWEPDWSQAGICDARGGGGQIGVMLLEIALRTAEANARLVGEDVKRVQHQREE